MSTEKSEALVKAVELVNEWMRQVDARWKIKEDLGITLNESTLRSAIKRSKDIAKDLPSETKDNQDEAIDDVSLAQDYQSGNFVVIGDEVVMKYKVKETGEEGSIEIPVRIVDDIFMDYSSVYWAKLSSRQLITKYNLHEYDENPNRVLSLLRSRMNLNKWCFLWSYYTYYKMKLELWDEKTQQLVEERKEFALNNRYDTTLVNEDHKWELNYLRNRIKAMHKKLNDHEFWVDALDKLKIEPIMFKEVVPENSQNMVAAFGDRHLWSSNHDDTVERIMRLAQDIASRPESYITLLWVWDWFENLVSGYMHIDQEMDMDPRFLDPRDLIQECVNVMVTFLKILIEKNKVVKFHMTWWNHDRVDSDNKSDRYRIWSYWLHMVIESKIKCDQLDIEYNADRVNSQMVWDTCYIWWHGESDIYKKNPSELIMMYGNRSAAYHVIIMWHLHSLRMKHGTIVKKNLNRNVEDSEWTNYTQVIIPPLTTGNFYSEQQIMKSSAPWALYIKPNEYCDAPDITTKRL